MLIRIGDEKREMLDAHLTVIKSKLVELMHQDDQKTQEEVVTVLRDVIENMPHKVYLYASLFGLIAVENMDIATRLFTLIMTTCLNQTLLQDQCGFRSKNVFRLLGYMSNLRVLNSESLCALLLSVSSENIQKDLVYHCILVTLSTENVQQKLS